LELRVINGIVHPPPGSDNDRCFAASGGTAISADGRFSGQCNGSTVVRSSTGYVAVDGSMIVESKFTNAAAQSSGQGKVCVSRSILRRQ
jgi:hypothetical protein